MRCWLVFALLVASATARAGDEKLNMAIGGGIDVGASPGWAVRFGETMDLTSAKDGLIYGTTGGYDYWRSTAGSGFSLPIGGYAGVRTHTITSTLGGGVGILAFEQIHDHQGAGIVPQLAATLGFELDPIRTITIDARMSRHVLAGAPDFTTWSVLLMIGKTLGN